VPSSSSLKTAPEAPRGSPEASRPRTDLIALLEGGRDIRARRKPWILQTLTAATTYRRVGRVVALLSLDLLGVFGAIWTALAVKAALLGTYHAHSVFSDATEFLAFAFLITVLLFARVGLYGPRETRPGLARVIATLFQATVIALIFALINGTEFNSYWIFYGSLVFGAIYIASLRYLYEVTTGKLLDRLGYQRRAVLVGTGHRIVEVAHALQDSHDLLNPIGFFALDSGQHEGLPDLGELSELRERIDQHAIEELIIVDPDFPQDRAVELVDRCRTHGVRVWVAPTTMEVLTRRTELVPGEGVPLLEVKPPVLEGFDFAVKRTFDFVIAAFLLLVSAPLMGLIALLVKFTSSGPVLHRSPRPGIAGVPFDCLKFRTMYEDAEDRQDELEGMNEKTGAIFKIRDDPRVTPIGRFLRRFSLDEMPQLINVLRSEMSLVGPRPLPLRDDERLADWHRRRYLVLPGITGLWQVSGRSDLDFDDMVRLDFLYLERWSVLLDLVILLKTVPAVLRQSGAY
jgi:exopolysaccharide biosynthesis polyprenyl glycosylphosphotransferase